MRKTSTKVDRFDATATVACTVGHTLQACFRCFDETGAAIVAHTFEALGAAAAGEVYRTIYGAQLSALDADTSVRH